MGSIRCGLYFRLGEIQEKYNCFVIKTQKKHTWTFPQVIDHPPKSKLHLTFARTAAETRIIMETKRADLHNHTTYSDGELSPDELVGLARELGLAALAVTDHDTIEALPEALEAAAREGIDLICGVEATLRFVEPGFRGSLHLLLYFPEELLLREDFRAATAGVLALGRGQALNRARLESLNRHFGPGGPEPMLPRPLTEDDLSRHGHHISRRHFALALKELGFDRDQVTHLIGNDSPAYIPSGMPLSALAGYLQRWPVLRVLAHPAAGSFPGDSHYKEVLPPYETVEALLPRFLELGLDGLEVSYPGHTPEWEERMRQEVQRLGLPLATGGSDCHDPEQRPLGAASVPYSVVEQMRELMAARLAEWEAD
jgi:predicted metal-dependent phosphoesterase TrpH